MRLTLISAAFWLTAAACGSGDPTAEGAKVASAAEGSAALHVPAEHSPAEISASAGPAAAPTAVPAAEGSGKSAGTASSELLGAIRLSDEFEAMDGWVMRARVVTLGPDGQIAVHDHDARPGIAFVLEGEMIEHRDDDPPALRRVGEAAFENTGTVHWWENATEQPARVLVVDIVPGDS